LEQDEEMTMKTFWLALIAVFAAASIGLADAEAKRVGGGKSVGKQAPSSTIQRDATPSAPAGGASSAQSPGGATATPATPAPAASATAPRAGQPAAAAPAKPGNRWLGPIAGLAAGLGLAALASHLGFGEGLASFMMIALMVIAAVVVVRMIMARRAASQPQPAVAGAYGYTGLGQEASVPNWQAPQVPAASRDQPVDAVRAAAQPIADGHVPAGFDVDGFVRNAKVYFVRLQAAFDAGDTADLREFTSPEMFAELKLEIDERQGAANQTDVVTLDGRLLGVEADGSEQLASVRFTGMLRERQDAPAEPFDEVWNFTRPTAGQGGWVLAGIQQLAGA
jgi:predicted lipid-binding transport protein (Tim44 family)